MRKHLSWLGELTARGFYLQSIYACRAAGPGCSCARLLSTFAWPGYLRLCCFDLLNVVRPCCREAAALRGARHAKRGGLPRNVLSSQQDCISLALRAPYGTLHASFCASEAPCPNVQPRAHARLTGLTT